jgi:hypothetical protein
MQLSFTVSIHREGELNGSRKRTQTLKGQTRDLSEDGIALLVSQVHLDGHHLAAGGRQLEIVLELDRGQTISMRVAPRRYERLDESETGCTYLIGARIMQLAEADRLRYLSFLAENLKSSKAADSFRSAARPEKAAAHPEKKITLELLKRKPAEDLR